MQRFERYALNERWPRDSYALNLASLSTAKALNVYSRLPLALANDYDILKKDLLQQYKLTVDDYRKKCYPTKQNADKNATQYVSRLEHFLNSWIQLSEISETFESLKEFLLQDQFLNSCPKELATFIREHSPSHLETMIDLANKFNLAHNAPSHEKERKGKHSPHQGGDHLDLLSQAFVVIYVTGRDTKLTNVGRNQLDQIISTKDIVNFQNMSTEMPG